MNASLRQILRLMVCLAAMMVTGGFAAAQPQEDPVRRPKMDTNPAPTQPQTGQPAQGGGVVQQQTRPFYLQAAVVALACGGAVWTVCRSSRRQ